MTNQHNDGLNVQYRPDLSEKYPWAVCFRNEPSRSFATRDKAEEYIAQHRAWRASKESKAGAR